MNSTWLITSELANQRARKVIFTCVVYTKHGYYTDTNYTTREIGSGVLKASVDRVSVDTLGRYIDRYSADVSAETRSTYISTDINRQAYRPTPGRYFTATWPPLGRYFNTTLTWSALATEFYLLYSTERGFQWSSSFFGLYLPQYSCLFSSYVFFLVIAFIYGPGYFRK